MKIKISKYLQIILLLTFFLPFIVPPGCSFGPPPQQLAEMARLDSLRKDSIDRANHYANADSINKFIKKEKVKMDSIEQSQTIPIVDSTVNQANMETKKDTLQIASDTTKHNNGDNLLPSERLSKKSSVLALLLRPNGHYSGIGFIVDNIGSLILGGIITAFILLIIGLIIKFINFNGVFHLANILAWGSLFGSIFIISDHLWGFWLCLAFGLVMLVFDSVLLIQLKKASKQEHNMKE